MTRKLKPMYAWANYDMKTGCVFRTDEGNYAVWNSAKKARVTHLDTIIRVKIVPIQAKLKT